MSDLLSIPDPTYIPGIDPPSAATSLTVNGAPASPVSNAFTYFLLITIGLAVTIALALLIWGATQTRPIIPTSTGTFTGTATGTSTNTGTGPVLYPPSLRYTPPTGTGLNNDPKASLTSFIGNRTHYPLPGNPSAITQVLGAETAGQCAQMCLSQQPSCRAYTFTPATNGCQLYQYSNPALFTLDTQAPQGSRYSVVGILDPTKQVKVDSDISLWYDTSDQRQFAQPSDPAQAQRYTHVKEITKLECAELCLRDTACRAISAELVGEGKPANDITAGPPYKDFGPNGLLNQPFALPKLQPQKSHSHKSNHQHSSRQSSVCDSDGYEEGSNRTVRCSSNTQQNQHSFHQPPQGKQQEWPMSLGRGGAKDPFSHDHRQYTTNKVPSFNLNWRSGAPVPTVTVPSTPLTLVNNTMPMNYIGGVATVAQPPQLPQAASVTSASSPGDTTRGTGTSSAVVAGAGNPGSSLSSVYAGAGNHQHSSSHGGKDSGSGETLDFDLIDGNDLVNCTLWDVSLSQANQPTNPRVFIGKKR